MEGLGELVSLFKRMPRVSHSSAEVHHRGLALPPAGADAEVQPTVECRQVGAVLEARRGAARDAVACGRGSQQSTRLDFAEFSEQVFGNQFQSYEVMVARGYWRPPGEGREG